ncbi:hypothetical protein SCUP234_08298 [Seiridium cupressi]
MDGSDDGENKQFLLHHDDDARPCKHQPRQALLLHTVFFILYVCFTIIALFMYSLHSSTARMDTLTLDGAHLALRQQRFILSEESPYAGLPSTDIDRAWTKLLDHINIRVSNRELTSLNQTSVQLPNGQGSLVWMDVSHQLHCVVSSYCPTITPPTWAYIANIFQKYLRQWIYRDYYHPEVGPEETPHWLLHTDHCLDLIRQALMCRADTSLMTFQWEADRREPMIKLESPEHVCVDWEDLMEKIKSPHLPRDVSTKYNSHSPLGLGSTTEEQRAIAWESMDSSAGEISLDKEWADVHNLPESAPFFWDEGRQIYLLNGHHSLHCMRKVRRAIVLYNYNRPQLDSYTHLVHCMDHLMQNIICEADDTPFYTSTTSNITTGLGQTRMCRSWEGLTEWANENTACFAYINETQGVNAVIERFRYCPRGSSLLGPMRKYFGYAQDWFQERPKDMDSLPRYWEGLDEQGM